MQGIFVFRRLSELTIVYIMCYIVKSISHESEGGSMKEYSGEFSKNSGKLAVGVVQQVLLSAEGCYNIIIEDDESDLHEITLQRSFLKDFGVESLLGSRVIYARVDYEFQCPDPDYSSRNWEEVLHYLSGSMAGRTLREVH